MTSLIVEAVGLLETAHRKIGQAIDLILQNNDSDREEIRRLLWDARAAIRIAALGDPDET
jgi:hypothetical protein